MAEEKSVDMLAKFDKRWSELSLLRTRYDADASLYNLDEFVWTQKDEHEVEQTMTDVKNITSNDPRVYADQMIDYLTGSEQQILLEIAGKQVQRNTGDETTPAEQFLRDAVESADERLMMADMYPVRNMQAGYTCLRGTIAGRIAVMKDDNDNTIVDILPADPKYVVYQPGFNGPVWVGYQTTRTGEEVEEQYKFTPEGDNNIVRDIWDSQNEYIYVNGSMRGEPRNHNLGYVPWVIERVPSGALLLDQNYYHRTGESVYAPVRELYKIMNWLMSVEATISMMVAQMSYEYRSNAGEGATITQESYPGGVKRVVPVELAGGYRPVEISDVKRSTQQLLSMVGALIQKATLSYMDYGQAPFEMSGTALTMLSAGKEAKVVRLTNVLDRYFARQGWMILDQFNRGGMKAKFGNGIGKMNYKPKDLKGDYRIKYRHVAALPETELATYARAEVAQRWLSGDTIRRSILQVQDPDWEELKVLQEKAEALIPALWLRKAAAGEIKGGDMKAAKIIAAQFGVSLAQLKSGAIQGDSTPRPEGKPNPGNLLPAFSSSGGQRSALNRQAADQEVS